MTPALPPLSPSDPPEVEHQLWRGMEGVLAFDIGARKGENFSHFAWLGYTEVVACEPQPESYAEMQARFADWADGQHMRKAVMLNVAVSDHQGIVELAEVPMAISKGEWVTPGTEGMEWSPEDWASVKTHQVPCTTLDELTDSYGIPDLVVIDTEGHEGTILRGGRRLLHSAETKWLIEFHAPGLKADCEALLAEAGHEVETIRHPHYAQYSHMFFQHGWLRATPRRG